MSAGAGCKSLVERDLPLYSDDERWAVFAESRETCKGRLATPARRALLRAYFWGLGEGILDVSSRMLSVKKSLLGADFGAPKTEPLMRVWEGSGLFSLFLDIALRRAQVGSGSAHAKRKVQNGDRRY